MLEKIKDWNLRASIRLEAEQNEIPVNLLVALVLTESAGDMWAWKVEPHYRYLVDVKTGKPFRALTAAEIGSEKAPRDFNHYRHSSRDTEWWGQQASWGPLQIMGAVTREYSFMDQFPALCSSRGLEYGVRHLCTLRRRFFDRDGWRGVVAAYNAGSPRLSNNEYVNQDYVNKVAAHGELDWLLLK